MIVTGVCGGPGHLPRRLNGALPVASTTAVRRRCLDTGVTTAEEKIVVFAYRLRPAPPAARQVTHHARRVARPTEPTSVGTTAAVVPQVA